MSGRHSDERRTHRDDKHRYRGCRSRSRSRSGSRSKSNSPDYERYEQRHKSGGSSSSHHNRNGSSSSHQSRDSEYKHKDRANTEELVCPPPPIISKVSLSIGKPNRPAKPVQMKLAVNKPVDVVKKLTVASAFSNNDSDDEEEEVPIKYSRNIGRDTPTSSGPNSFGKTKQGFCDSKKMFEKTLREYSED